MNDIEPGTLMVLYGPTGTHGPTLTWMIQGKVKADTIAIVDPLNLMVRDYSQFGLRAEYDVIARDAMAAFRKLRDGFDLSSWATHMLDPEQRHQVIIPIDRDDQLEGQEVLPI